MRKTEYAARIRLRYAMGIGLEEYSSRNIDMVRDFQSALMMTSGYIGWFDTWEKTLRIFVFEGSISRDKALKEARSIGFTSAGDIDGELFVSNAVLKRPHLKNVSTKKQYYRELYR